MYIINSTILIAFIVLLIGCAASPSNRGTTMSQFPMYGGVDRQADPRLKKADEKLISDVTKEFGSREKASQTFIDQGIRYYQVNDLSMAMKRFNQAWLLDPNNPDSFWGYAIIYHDEGENCESKRMFDKALELGLSKPISLADAGRVFTLCAVSDPTLDLKTKDQFIKESDGLYTKALSISPAHDYIYGSWATAYYWRGDYANAWKMVNKQRSLGGTPGGRFINILREKMPEPHQ